MQVLQRIAIGLAVCLVLAPAAAQAQVEGVFGDLGTAEAEEVLGEGEGFIVGQVVDGANGAPLSGATVILVFPPPADGGAPRREVAVTDASGFYEFPRVPAGDAYEVQFIKAGYRTSKMTAFEVSQGEESRADFPMEPVPSEASGEVMELDAFVVEASTVNEMMTALELRLESDQLLNVMSAEDLSRYAASDVADALKRVAGVNVVEGQFAIIRGLEDRYSATLYNGAPVPSPDPDRQSVQLDLFPSDVVTNLLVAKSFAPASPSNASGGSIDIVTHDYPEELELKVEFGAGFEENAVDEFLEFHSGSTAGTEADPEDVIETDFGGHFGGRHELFARELRLKVLANHEVDYRTQEGFQEGREPRPATIRSINRVPTVVESGGLAFGELALSDGRFDQITSTRDEQLTAYAALGLDLDSEGHHRVDASYFYTHRQEESVDLRENGFFPGFDYSELIQATEDEDELLGPLRGLDAVATLSSSLAGAESTLREEVTDEPSRGALWFSSFGRTSSFEEERDLQILQLNGEHDFDLLGGLDVRWAANRAWTTQEETALGNRFFYEPCGWAGQSACPPGVARRLVPRSFPATVRSLGPGSYFASGNAGGVVFSRNEIEEGQWFGRLDLSQAVAPTEQLHFDAKAGVWWESSERDVDAFFVENVTQNGQGQWLVDAPTLPRLGSTLLDRLDPLSGTRSASSRASREITAGYVELKTTIAEKVDLLGGLRVESIVIESTNDPFTGEFQFDRPQTFPVAYLFFDRVDTDAEGFTGSLADTTFPDQILGIDVPVDPDTGIVDLLTRQEILSLVNGEIDERKLLPSAGIAIRPLEGLSLRGSYSQTVVRPSFREIGYYVSVEPGTDDRTVGNPQLELSEVESYDFRAEYLFGDFGDLLGFSFFYKTIDDPIESIVLRNPLDFDSGSAALFRTFFNNPSEAELWGIEVEARKSFDFLSSLGIGLPGIETLDHLSVGGNFTWIDAEVDRTAVEMDRASGFFLLADGDRGRFRKLDSSRRLFGQPEWIANADVTFDHPDWGTTVTLAVFAISDVLDAAGTATLGRDGDPEALTLDRYIDEFHQLDLVVSQRIWRGLEAKMSVKNLTDSTRRRIYDPEQTRRTVVERSLKVGRDWSFSLSYTHEF